MVKFLEFNANSLKIDKNSYKKLVFITLDISQKKDSKYVNIFSVNPLHLIVDKTDGFIEEKEGSKYLNLAFTDNISEVLKKYAELWDGIKNLIEK